MFSQAIAKLELLQGIDRYIHLYYSLFDNYLSLFCKERLKMRHINRYLSFLIALFFCIALLPSGTEATEEYTTIAEEPAADGANDAGSFSTVDELMAGLASGAPRLDFVGGDAFVIDRDIELGRYVEVYFGGSDVTVSENARLIVRGNLYTDGALRVLGSMSVHEDAWVQVGALEGSENISVETYGSICVFSEVFSQTDFDAAAEQAAQIPFEASSDIFFRTFVRCPLAMEGDVLIPRHMQVCFQRASETDGTLSMTVRGTLRVEGTMYIYDHCVMQVEGRVVNCGDITLLSDNSDFVLIVMDGGTLENRAELNASWGKGVELRAGGILENSGSINIFQYPYSSKGEILVSGTLANDGTVYIHGAAMSTATGRLSFGDSGVYRGAGELRILEPYQDPANAIVGFDLDRFERSYDAAAEAQVFRLIEAKPGDTDSDDDDFSITFSEDHSRASITGNVSGLYARVALTLDNGGQSGLYITQAAISSSGTVAIPSFSVPGLEVKGVSLALVRTLADISTPTPSVAAAGSVFFS